MEEKKLLIAIVDLDLSQDFDMNNFDMEKFVKLADKDSNGVAPYESLNVKKVSFVVYDLKGNFLGYFTPDKEATKKFNQFIGLPSSVIKNALDGMECPIVAKSIKNKIENCSALRKFLANPMPISWFQIIQYI